MKFLIVSAICFLSGCAWLQSHPEVEKELEEVGEAVVKQGVYLAEKDIEK